MSLKLILAAGALLASTSVMAQTAPATDQSADDLVCQLSGDCGGMADLEATQDKPESRGFKLARKTTAVEPVDVTSPSRTNRARVAAEPARAAQATPGRSRIMPAAPIVGRADLRVDFVTGSAELTPAGKREADRFLTAISSPKLAGKKFRIEGHTDSVGSRDFNINLSKRRAQAVVDYMAAKGADASRFAVAGYGFDRPLAGTAASSGLNRRVEVIVVK